MNTDLLRYYAHQFFSAFSSAHGAFFTMAYFYFMGYSVQQIIIVIGNAAVTANIHMIWMTQ